MVNLKKFREDSGMTQDELAEKIGTTRQAISNIENGLAKPNVPNAKKLGEIFGFSWGDFYDDNKNGG